MPIISKLGEADITDAAMYVLLDAGKSLDTTTVKRKIRDLLEPAGVNNDPLVNRNDEVIDQIIRNIVSHRFESQNNIINCGFVKYDKGCWKITEEGKRYLRERMKRRFERELN